MRRNSPSLIRVSQAHRTAPWMLVLLPLLATRGRADIIVGPNDDLVAIVAAAADGETLILESNGTYVGTLTWFERSLTLRAGDGFTPTVRGSDDGPALAFGATSTAPTIARLVGIDFEAGTETGPTPVKVSLLAAGTGVGTLATLRFEDCRLLDGVVLSGTGDFHSQVTLQSCAVGATSIAGTGDAVGELIATNSTFTSVSATGTGAFRSDVRLVGCSVDGAVGLSPASNATVDFDARRTRFRSGIDANASVLGQTEALLVSCLFQSPSTASGITAIESSAPADVRGINLTITRCSLALDTEAPSRFSNLLIYQNAATVGAGVLPADVDNSMFGVLPAGFGATGNFQGIPLWDSQFALLPGSPGIDAGDSSVAQIGALDLDGSPRITDGDQSGTAEVNVGAVEHYGNCPPATAILLNGSGINPLGCEVVSLPQLGGVFRATVAPTANTIATLVAYDAQSLLPLVIPGIEGEILVALSVNVILDLQTGNHQFAIPNLPSLVGLNLASQGFRILQIGPLLGTQALNGWAMTLGY
ncbi:MAG: hypothetical protein GC161_19535 [Planctomycetaceae bacterium]|nr:hypothetical protein [Planctomycetaceae bacterium]